MGALDQRAIDRVSGDAWTGLRDSFFTVSDTLLSVSDSAYGELTTIYVKYKPSAEPAAPVYAVVWLKSSKQMIVGLALPSDFDHAALGKAPQGARYRGLTKYLTLRPGDAVPDEITDWARAAFDVVVDEAS